MTIFDRKEMLASVSIMCCWGRGSILDCVQRIETLPAHCIFSVLGTISITRRWVKNFAEIARPLTRLTGKVAWKWTQSEQLSFEILKIKCATKSSIHGIDLSSTVQFYTDASGFGAGRAITQFRHPMEADPQRASPNMPEKPSAKDVEVPILYDAFTFSPTQRKYPTYKRELCAIVTFCKKYDYLCKHPYKPAVVYTDHKPLTHFLASDLHEGTYGHWADQLRRLNITIQYVPGHRNKVADGLSRTIFDAPECTDNGRVMKIREELSKQGPKWVWKDGVGGFDAFLKSLNQSRKDEILEQDTMDGLSVFSLDATP